MQTTGERTAAEVRRLRRGRETREGVSPRARGGSLPLRPPRFGLLSQNSESVNCRGFAPSGLWSFVRPPTTQMEARPPGECSGRCSSWQHSRLGAQRFSVRGHERGPICAQGVGGRAGGPEIHNHLGHLTPRGILAMAAGIFGFQSRARRKEGFVGGGQGCCKPGGHTGHPVGHMTAHNRESHHPGCHWC